MSHEQDVSLDDLDFAILSQLQEDGRRPFSEIARNLDVAVNTVRNRIARMVENGTLNFVGRVNPLHAGFHAYASIFVRVEPSRLVEEVAQQLAEFPEVSFVCMAAGDFDLWMDVMCRDNQHLTELLTERLQKIPGVVATKTVFILKVFKYGQPDLNTLRQEKIADTPEVDALVDGNLQEEDQLPYR